MDISPKLLAKFFSLHHAAVAGSAEILKVWDRMKNGGTVLQQLKEDNTPVTEADIKAQEAIVPVLRRLFPDDALIGEENDLMDASRPDEAHIFVDPIDGTSRFARGESGFTVLIGRQQGQNFMGIVHVPLTDASYFGACWDGEKVAVRVKADEVVELGVSKKSGPPRMLAVTLCQPERYQKINEVLVRAGYAVIRAEPCGIACLRVANGITDAYVAPGGLGRGGVKHGTMKWDFAAGTPVVLGAGGAATQISGETLTLDHTSFLASNGLPELHGKLVELLKPFTPENNFGTD